jgi:hypothetical protein
VKNSMKTGLIILIMGIMILAAACGSQGTSTSLSSKKGIAVKLAFTAQPAAGVAGSAFETQPAVAAEDADGNIVNTYNGKVTLTITAGTGDINARLLGATDIQLKNGAIGFKFLSIDKAGNSYTLTVSGGNLAPAISAPFSISPGEAAQLAFTAQPLSGTVGIPLVPNPEVTVEDKFGNKVADYSGSVTLIAIVTYSSPSSYGDVPTIQPVQTAISGTTTVNFVNGVARFTDISSGQARPNYTLKAVSNALSSATTASFTIWPGTPAKLFISVQPEGATTGTPFEIQPVVAVMDMFGNVVNGARVSVTVSITPGSGTAGAVLSGTNTLISDGGFGGLAEYEDLSIDKIGSGYTLTAAVSGLPPVTSVSFDVTAPAEKTE